jgi:hypothetical protein
MEYSPVRFGLTLVLLLATLAAFGSPSQRPQVQSTPPAAPAEPQTYEQLASAILSHVRERLPPSESGAVDAEAARVRAFARSVTTQAIYSRPPDRLEAAAIAAVDSASKQPVTASELVRAATVGVLDCIGHGARFLSTSTASPPVPAHSSFRDVGNIRIVVPSLTLEKMSDLDCSGFDQVFELSHSNVSGLILDLRGNQGDSLQIAVCLASQLVTPGVPIYTIQTTQGRDTLKSRATSLRPPVSLPVAIFIDKDTNSGALGLAAALQDQRQARIIGEQRQQIDGDVLAAWPSPKGMYSLPVAIMLHADGRALATSGVRIDVAVHASDNDAMMAAARKEFGEHQPETPRS